MATKYDRYDELWRLTRAGKAPEGEFCTPTFLISALNAAHRGRAVYLESRGVKAPVAYILPRKVGSLLVCVGGQVYAADESKVEPPSASQYPGFFAPNDEPYVVSSGTNNVNLVLHSLLITGLPHVQRPLPGGMAPHEADEINAAIQEAVDYGMAADQERVGHDANAASLIATLEFDIQL